ncbi:MULTISPECIES: HNH endonuclease [Klebsiella pneumoniae complex]|uniref:HNH endonuclease n=1 Tax=Klebsiella pneumoniae complex TaxID=3390273 RepID=UPI002FF9336F|nr:HNH endonuclease [Klebsiella pneumoniae]HBV7524186.1 HNH endonuclease [Klebsiella pneumoniae]
MKLSVKIHYTKKSRKYILKYNRYDRSNHNIWNNTKGVIAIIRKQIRQHYLKEQGKHCAYCRMHNHTSHGLSWDIDHILPKDKFPQFLFQPLNLILTCRECNIAKTNDIYLSGNSKVSKYKYPHNSDDYEIIHPHFDIYDENILLEKTGKYYTYHPKTHKGRMTIIACNLSRYSLIESYNTDDVDVLRAISEQVLDNEPFLNDPDFIPISPESEREILRRLEKTILTIKKTTEFSDITK